MNLLKCTFNFSNRSAIGFCAPNPFTKTNLPGPRPKPKYYSHSFYDLYLIIKFHVQTDDDFALFLNGPGSKKKCY